jgi:sulfur-carrier protein
MGEGEGGVIYGSPIFEFSGERGKSRKGNTETMQVTVKFFSFFRPIAGTDQLSIALPDGATLGDLLKSLNQKFATGTFTGQRAMIMVNSRNASPETVLHHGDDVLFLPVLGGG